MDNTPSPQISPASTGSALGPDDCGNASDERKPQRVAWDSDTEVANPLAQPPLRVVDVQEEDAGSEGPVGDALKRPAQRVPLDAADGDADAGEAEQDPHPASPRLDDDEGARLAPVTPDMDEEEQPPSNYVPRENRTPYMERKIRDLRAQDRQQGGDSAAEADQEPQNTPGLGQGLLVHRSRLEVEVEEAAARRTAKLPSYMKPTASSATKTVRSPGSESPSQQRASPQRQSPPAAARFRSASDGAAGAGLEDVLVARKSRVERAQEAAATDATRYEALPPAKAAPAEPGLDQILIKKKSKLEMEKEAAAAAPRPAIIKKHSPRVEPLEDVLLIKKSLLEIEKEAAGESAKHAKIKSPTRSELHMKDQGEAWGNEPLWAVQRPHKSRLELEQEAWRRTEKSETRPPPPRTLRAPLRTSSATSATSPSFMRDTASSARKHYSPAPTEANGSLHHEEGT